jgi:hypothetical protein
VTFWISVAAKAIPLPAMNVTTNNENRIEPLFMTNLLGAA